MAIKNPILIGAETAVATSGQYVAVCNDGTVVIYASAAAGRSAGLSS